MLTMGLAIGGAHVDQRWKLILYLRCFARSDYRSLIYEIKNTSVSIVGKCKS